MVLSRLGDIITNKYRKKITKELYEIEKKKNFQIRKKKRLMIILSSQQIPSVKKKNINIMAVMIQTTMEQETENLFSNVDNDDDGNDYYKPILVEISFKNNYKYYESRGDKDKKLSVKQYLYEIMPYISNLINDHKTFRNESKEWKIQINVHINSVSSNDTGETRTIFVLSDNEEIRSGNEA